MMRSIHSLQNTQSHQCRYSILGSRAHLEVSYDEGGQTGAEEIREYVVRFISFSTSISDPSYNIKQTA